MSVRDRAEKNKALFIDRDGTINYDCPYCFKPEDLRIYEDSIEIMKNYQENGYLIIIITNQSGISRGYFTIGQMNEFNNAMRKELLKSGVRVDAIFFCPHHPDDHCACRKPGTEMIERAVKDFNIDLEKSMIIGDRDDMEGEMARKLKVNYRIINRK